MIRTLMPVLVLGAVILFITACSGPSKSSDGAPHTFKTAEDTKYTHPEGERTGRDTRRFRVREVERLADFLQLAEEIHSHYIGHCPSRYYLATYSANDGAVSVCVYSISKRTISELELRRTLDMVRARRRGSLLFQYPRIAEYEAWRTKHVTKVSNWEREPLDESAAGSLGVFR